jgi:hypothetical protein
MVRGLCLNDISSEKGEIVVYQPDEITRLEVRVDEDTVWLTQSQMAELFGRDRSVITKHIRNIFVDQELDEKTNVHFLHIANSDKPIKIFSLDVIISVGYRIKSVQGTRLVFLYVQAVAILATVCYICRMQVEILKQIIF